MSLNRQVEHIISNPLLDRFTVKEIRAAYLFLPNQVAVEDLSELRRSIYAELVKFEKKGWLKKSVSAKKGVTTYKKTELFDMPFKQLALTNQKLSEPSVVPNKDVKEMYTRLNDYKNDLLEGIGKADEFRSLREIYPHLHDQFQPEYNKVRESNSRLLGKIDALEKTIETIQLKEK